MVYTVDRTEGEFAVCEDEEGNFLDISLALLPGVRPGDVINERDGKYVVDSDETARRRKRVVSLQSELFE